MKIVFAPDSFKNSLSAPRVADILKEKAEEIFPDCEMQSIPLADGDRGTVNTLLSVLGGTCHRITARNYMGEMTEVAYGVIHGDTMIIETSDLLQEQGESRGSIGHKVLFSSSYGVGEVILQGLDRGFRRFYIGAGASMANDGGMGCVQALGVRFYDERGQQLEAAGINLQEVARVDDSRLDSRIREAEFTVMCSVNNELTGDRGATYVYGAQNGAGPDELLCLEKGMRNYARHLEKKRGLPLCNVAGAGACGGLPASLRAFCSARLTSGISTVLKLIRFEELIEDASLVVVGEGMIDQTTIYGKAIAGIGMLCKAKGIPVAAVVGGMGKGAEQMYHYGVTSMIAAVNRTMEEDYAIENAEELLAQAAERLYRLLVGGMQMQAKEDCLCKAKVNLNHGEEEQNRIHWAVDPNKE